jgi:hypothetical protein
MRRVVAGELAVVAVFMCVVMGCGGSAAMGSSLYSRASVRATSCPKGAESSIERLHSTNVSRGALAPAGTVWTTVCSRDHQAVFRGGPLNDALDSAREDPKEICPAIAVPPALVILRYRTETRQFIVNMGGCPGVVLHDGTELSFTTAGLEHIPSRLASALI